MVNGREPDDIFDMLADEATVGLSEADRSSLSGKLSGHPEVDVDSFFRAAAAIDVATFGEIEPMPSALKSRLARLGSEMTAAPIASEADSSEGVLSPSAGGGTRAIEETGARSGGLRLVLWSGWLAAAATIIIAVGINVKSGEVDARIDRQRLMAGGAAVAQWSDWEDTETPGVSGDVVWDEEEQAGYMRFVGLPANDPSVEQYQLWIIDERGMQQRVNGGIFNSTGEGELVVPIQPGLPIDGAGAFAVTIERPGGVAVSDMTRKSLIAAL